MYSLNITQSIHAYSTSHLYVSPSKYRVVVKEKISGSNMNYSSKREWSASPESQFYGAQLPEGNRRGLCLPRLCAKNVGVLIPLVLLIVCFIYNRTILATIYEISQLLIPEVYKTLTHMFLLITMHSQSTLLISLATQFFEACGSMHKQRVSSVLLKSLQTLRCCSLRLVISLLIAIS